MKANMIKILLAGCDQTLLLNALSLLDERVQQQVFSLATGDTKFYDEYSLPKPTKDNIIAFVGNKKSDKEIVGIEEVTPKNFCSEVYIRYRYNTYRWYKTEEEAAVSSKDNSYHYNTGDYKYKGQKSTGTDTDSMTVNVEEWLSYTNSCVSQQ